MTFRDRYIAIKDDARKLPLAFIKKTVDATGVSEATVRQWLTGTCKPNPFIRKQLEELFNAPFDELFPANKQ